MQILILLFLFSCSSHKHVEPFTVDISDNIENIIKEDINDSQVGPSLNGHNVSIKPKDERSHVVGLYLEPIGTKCYVYLGLILELQKQRIHHALLSLNLCLFLSKN